MICKTIMSAYRYLVFPEHQQPTADEADELQSYTSLLKHRFAVGRERKSESLTIAFEQEIFDQTISSNEGFELLIRKWQVHGCELVDKLKFVKDHDALRPVQARGRRVSQDTLVVAKKQLAQEAVARSLLSVQRTLEHYTWLQRVGRAVPYALIAFGTLALIVAGFYISGRIQEGNRERRQDTVERVSGDAMSEKLNGDKIIPVE
jgi:hypothetical protein